MSRHGKHASALSAAAAPLIFFSLFAIIPAACLGVSKERQRDISAAIPSYGEPYQVAAAHSFKEPN
jgi:hypothetical protein